MDENRGEIDILRAVTLPTNRKLGPYEKFSSKDGLCLLFLSAAFSIIETKKGFALCFAFCLFRFN